MKFSIIQLLVGGFTVGGFILLTALFFIKPEAIPGSIEDNLDLIVGAWIVNVTTVVNWVFGSSKSSSDKTNLLMNKPPTG